jgi:hypothetical protein
MSAETPKKARRGMGRVAFHALRETIKAEIEAGYTVRMIYERHQDALPIAYEQLRAYIARNITGTVGSRGGRACRRKSPVPTGDQTVQPVPVQEQPNTTPLIVRPGEDRPKRIVTRVPDIDRLVFGSKAP